MESIIGLVLNLGHVVFSNEAKALVKFTLFR